MKREQWTRIVRVGQEYAGTARLHNILTDMISFARAMTESDEESQNAGQESSRPDKAWALLFDAEACDEKHASKTLEEMELQEALFVKYAKKISGLREQLRLTAATVATQPDQL